jgi:hypothetical protein
MPPDFQILPRDPYAWVVPCEASATIPLAGKLEELRRHFRAPATRQSLTTAERFRELAARWHAETAHLSATTAIAMHPAYQEIIGLGREAIPLVLARLEKKPGQWFWALRALTGIDPVPPQNRGRIPEMRDAWLTWGREQGFRW